MRKALKSIVNCNGAFAALLAVFALTISDGALAQFKWKDANGRWVYSDQPPPAGATNQPLAAPSAKTISQAAGRSDGKSATEPKANADDKALAAKRKELDAAPDAKAKQDLVKKNQGTCDETRANLKTLQGEVRVTMTDANGEKRFLSEQEKQSRSAAAQKDLATHCNG